MEKLILECVVRSALIALCTALALRVLRVEVARVRHGIWASVVVLMLVLPAWTAWGPKAVLRVLTAPNTATAAPVAVAQQPVADPDGPALPMKRASWTWQDSVLSLYLLGFFVLAARLATGTIRARMLVRAAANRDGRLTSKSCATPITVGWLRPAVILPSGWKNWSQAELNAVLAHEGEHARRRDPLVQWLALLNRAVFWFHPLAWWLDRRLSALAEEACDDAVLAGGHDPVQYSECLLGLARMVQESGARVTAVGMAMPGTFLPERIRRIVAGVPVQRISRGRLVGVAMASAIVSTVFTAGAVGYAAQEKQLADPPVVASVAVPETLPPVEPVRALPRLVKPKILLAQAVAQAPPTTPAASQSLSGTVVDPSNAVVANAPITLTNTATGVSISTTSNMTGAYQFQGIDAGTYTVTVKVPGFRTTTQNGIVIAPADAHNLGKLFLQVGAISESVSVTASRSTAAAMVGRMGPMTTLAPVATLAQATPPPARDTTTRQYPDHTGNGPIRIGGNIQAASLVNAVKPVYPPELLQQGIQGTVKIEAVLSKDGQAVDTRVISSPDPGLTQISLDALKLWRYRPTLLNGEPVEVLTTIDFNYSFTN